MGKEEKEREEWDRLMIGRNPFSQQGRRAKDFHDLFLGVLVLMWDPGQLWTEDTCVHLIVTNRFGPEKQTVSVLWFSIGEQLTRTTQKHAFSRHVPLSDMLPVFRLHWRHEEQERMVICGIHVLKAAPAQVLDGTREHWHRPVGWELPHVRRSSRSWAKVENWAGILIGSFLREVLLAHLTPNLGRKHTVCHINLQRLLTRLIKHWRACQLKIPLSKSFAIWLLQLLLSQLGFSIAFISNLETEPVPVPAVLSKLNGCFF